ncbi:MAG: [ribosomal protein S18]-alanine N-acetyltransferase [Actinomycetota bacterium]|nr:[ribosomal protein S18]-alanine N-acetyltransferase [Actinomycetota bacterium]
MPVPDTAAISLVPLRWWHVEQVLPLERELFGPSAWTAETFWSELAHPENRQYLVAVEPSPGASADSEDGTGPGDGGTRIVGYAGVMVNASQADVQTIAVAPRAAGRGLGGRLLDALVGAAVRRGATCLMLEVRSDNAPALRLYTGRGFERIAIRRGYYQPEGADAWVMRRRPLTLPARDDSGSGCSGRHEQDQGRREQGQDDRKQREQGQDDRKQREQQQREQGPREERA